MPSFIVWLLQDSSTEQALYTLSYYLYIVKNNLKSFSYFVSALWSNEQDAKALAFFISTLRQHRLFEEIQLHLGHLKFNTFYRCIRSIAAGTKVSTLLLYSLPASNRNITGTSPRTTVVMIKRKFIFNGTASTKFYA